jgi:hypothetical protein
LIGRDGRWRIKVMSKKFLVAAAVACVALMATIASAQSLGTVAKQEEARRKTVKAPGKVYTNENLKSSDGSPAPEAAAPAAPAADATQSGASTPPAANQQTPPPDDQKRDEKYWKDRLKQARDAVDRSKSFADALQSRINALTTDFAARSDPAQRSVIEQDRRKALAELDRVNQEIKDNSKAIANLQDEARKAGVPAAWYR